MIVGLRRMAVLLGAFLICSSSSKAGQTEDKTYTSTDQFIKGSVVSNVKNDGTRLSRVLRPSMISPQFKKAYAADVVLSDNWSKSFKSVYKAELLNERELSHLGKFDLSLLIDRSGSMNKELNCLKLSDPHISRWEWCRLQAGELSKQLSKIMPFGITVVPFSDFADRFTNVSSSQLNSIFKKYAPAGQTMLGDALGAEIDRFLYERSLDSKRKPLLLAVITDGAPNDPQSIVEEVIHVSKKIKQDDIRIVFFIIGDDPMAAAFMDYLRKSRIEAGIEFDIVSSLSFAEVSHLGLPKSLANQICPQ